MINLPLRYVTVQQLYDRQEGLAEISESSLHEIFSAVTADNNPSPSGKDLICVQSLMSYAKGMRDVYGMRIVLSGRAETHLLRIAKFCESFATL